MIEMLTVLVFLGIQVAIFRLGWLWVTSRIETRKSLVRAQIEDARFVPAYDSSPSYTADSVLLSLPEHVRKDMK